MVFDPVGDELVAALECEADVFLDAYGNTIEQFAQEYDSYADSTGFMTILDESGQALATTRFIAPGKSGLKTLNDVARPPWQVNGLRSARAAGIDPSKTWDIATIAVRRSSGNGGLCSAALYHGIVASAQANGIDSIVMIMDARARRLLSATGLQTQVLPGTKEGEYLGSAKSTPVWADLERMFKQQRQTNPDGYRLVYQGIGLNAVTFPADWTWYRRNCGAGYLPAPRQATDDRPAVALPTQQAGRRAAPDRDAAPITP